VLCAASGNSISTCGLRGFHGPEKIKAKQSHAAAAATLFKK